MAKAPADLPNIIAEWLLRLAGDHDGVALIVARPGRLRISLPAFCVGCACAALAQRLPAYRCTEKKRRPHGTVWA
jgi:hypothetical protein